MPPDEFGAWGQWAGAIGTVAAVVVALWVAISDARRRERDEHQRDLEREDRLAEQARTITTEVHVVGGDPEEIRSDYALIRVRVSNHGTLPITSVVLARVRLIERYIDCWTPGEQVRVETVIPPQDNAIFAREYPSDWYPAKDVQPWMLVASVWFNDAQGRRWLRAGNGEPQPYNPENPPDWW